jgi:putative Holliday junction resolvase
MHKGVGTMVLGVDFGDSRTGFAASDALGFSAHTLETYNEKNMKKVAEHTAELVKKLDAKKIVLGLPKNMNGTIGERGKKTRAFAKLINELIDTEIIFWDERLTTVSAHNLMNQTNTRGQKRKDSVDKIAAAFILQAYLDSIKNKY